MQRRAVGGLIIFFCLSFLYFGFVNYNEFTEAPIARNLFTGDLWLQHGGWNLSPPWVLVAKVDARPTRVCVLSSGRAYNCRLVQFQPQYFREFVVTEGFRYYWWSNRFSFNLGYDEEYRGTRDLLRGYGYSVKKYPFMEVIDKYQ